MFRFMVGDMTNPDDMDILLDGEQADLIYIDPPWSTALLTRFYNIANREDTPELITMFEAIAFNLCHYTTGAFCVEMGVIGKDAIISAITDTGLHIATEYNLIYNTDKPCFMFHGGKEPAEADDPYRFMELRGQKIVEAAIKMSTDPGDTVLDFCVGLGMVARACHRTGRRCIGMELSSDRLDKSLDYCFKKGIEFEVTYG